MAKFGSGSLAKLNDTFAVPTDLQQKYTGQGSPGATVGFDLSGAWVGQVVFEATIDDVRFFAIAAHQTGLSGLPGPIALAATVPGVYSVNAHGYSQVRVRMNTYASGTAAVAAAITASQTELLLLREQMITNELLAQILGVPLVDVANDYRNDPGFGT